MLVAGVRPEDAPNSTWRRGRREPCQEVSRGRAPPVSQLRADDPARAATAARGRCHRRYAWGHVQTGGLLNENDQIRGPCLQPRRPSSLVSKPVCNKKKTNPGSTLRIVGDGVQGSFSSGFTRNPASTGRRTAGLPSIVATSSFVPADRRFGHSADLALLQQLQPRDLSPLRICVDETHVGPQDFLAAGHLQGRVLPPAKPEQGTRPPRF